MLTVPSARNVIACAFLCFQVLFCAKWQWRTVTEMMSCTNKDFPHNLSLNHMHKSMPEPKMIFTLEQIVTTRPSFSKL